MQAKPYFQDAMSNVGATFRAMTRQNWLYNITHVDNVTSILEHGLLSHDLAQAHHHQDISLAAVQDRREKELREGLGLRLHQYANLYIDARNPMMYYLVSNADDSLESLCVILVNHAVLDEPGTLVSDGNAASDYTRFFTPEEAVQQLDFDLVMATDWNDPDKQQYYIKKRRKCAEVLVRNKVNPRFIEGVAFCDEQSATRFSMLNPDVYVTVQKSIFFR